MRMYNSSVGRFPRPLPLAIPALLCGMLMSGAVLLDLLLIGQQGSMGMAGGSYNHDIGQTVIWLLGCRMLPLATTCAGTLILWRMIQSAVWQHEHTWAVLGALLKQPPLVTPSRLVPLLQDLRIERRTHIIACDSPVALCYGYLQPRLLFSTGALHQLSPLELEAVFHHEKNHLSRRDPLRRLLLRAIADALPLRALRRTAEAMPLAQELAADRAVLAAMGPEALSGALLKVGDALSTLGEVDTETISQDSQLAVGAFGSIDARIDQILGVPIPGQPGASGIVQAVVVVALLASGPLLCLLLPFPAPLFWSASMALAVGWPRLRQLPDLFNRHKLVAGHAMFEGEGEAHGPQ